MDGPNRCSGRVEVLHNDVWGTVCDEGWDLREARVVCRQLGCGTALSSPKKSKYGEGKGQIWLSGLDCKGTEGSLFKCKSKAWGENACNHVEDASVECSGNLQNSSTLCPFCLKAMGQFLSHPIRRSGIQSDFVEL